MDLPCGRFEVIVTSVERREETFCVSLQSDTKEATFSVRIDIVSGMQVLVGADPLTVWLAGDGRLWALQPLLRTLLALDAGSDQDFPIVLRPAQPGEDLD